MRLAARRCLQALSTAGPITLSGGTFFSLRIAPDLSPNALTVPGSQSNASDPAVRSRRVPAYGLPRMEVWTLAPFPLRSWTSGPFPLVALSATWHLPGSSPPWRWTFGSMPSLMPSAAVIYSGGHPVIPARRSSPVGASSFSLRRVSSLPQLRFSASLAVTGLGRYELAVTGARALSVTVDGLRR